MSRQIVNHPNGIYSAKREAQDNSANEVHIAEGCRIYRRELTLGVLRATVSINVFHIRKADSHSSYLHPRRRDRFRRSTE